MASVIGIDFGTTNSLVAYVDPHRDVADVLRGRDNRPHPSTIWYHSDQVIVGREARDQLDGDGAAFGIIKSPKRLLDRDLPVTVGGAQRDPSDVVADVLNYLRQDAMARAVPPDRAVITVPVDLDGAGRARLRAAARKAGIGIVQFVHEPLAALYAWLRTQSDFRRRAAELDGRRLLVVDWGGGTLDLTLCLVRHGRLVQIGNAGDNDVGGDYFDELISNAVRERHAREHHISELREHEPPESRKRLLARCETAKIALSTRETAQVTLRNYLRTEQGRHLNLTLTRQDLTDWTRSKIDQGLSRIDELLEEHGLVPHDIELCLPTGGMVNAPAVQDGLIQRFGARKLSIANGDSIIAEGAAWIAHDALRLSLAKPIELEQPDGSFLELVPEGHRLPVENEVAQIPGSQFFCTDPRDGVARFHFARPKRLGSGSRTAPRRTHATLAISIDPNARPFLERLHVDLSIDHDYVLTVEARSTGRGDRCSIKIHDLEFAIDLPGSKAAEDIPETGADAREGKSVTGVRLRPNVTNKHGHWRMVPGDIIEQWQPEWFDTRSASGSSLQCAERDYYRPCAVCKRLKCSIDMEGCAKCMLPAMQPASRGRGDANIAL